MATFVLLHPPLLGPAVWGPFAAVLAGGGHRVAVPDLRDAVSRPERWWERATDLAAAALPPGGSPAAGGIAGPAQPARLPGAGRRPGPGAGAGPVVVAHSGAGVLVPLVTSRLGASAAVFVDALVPATGETDPSEGFRDFLAGLPVSDDGHLPPWSTWWGPDAMAEQVPDPELRRAIEADQRVLPVAFYDHAVPTPPDWTPARVGYLRLSPAYADDADEAVARGWPTRRLDGRHLDLATRPDEVAAAIVLLADA